MRRDCEYLFEAAALRSILGQTFCDMGYPAHQNASDGPEIDLICPTYMSIVTSAFCVFLHHEVLKRMMSQSRHSKRRGGL